MKKKSLKKVEYHEIGRWGAMITVIGTLLSGPVAMLLVYLVKAQPVWVNVETFVENFHLVQTVPFYFGFLLLGGSILMMASIYLLAKRKGKPLLGLIFTTVGCGMIFFNYFTQNTVVPAMVRNYSMEKGAIIAFLTMSNPLSIAWAVEMWGYGFLGLGTWLAASFFKGGGMEGAAKALFILNGILSIIGALVTSLDVTWVLSAGGLIAYGLWNLLYIVMVMFFHRVLKTRYVKIN